MNRPSGEIRISWSASLFKEGKLETPIVLPKMEKEDWEEEGQMITKLSIPKMKFELIVAELLPSLIFHFLRLIARPELFFNSRNSLFGNPTEGEGSGKSSSINTSNRWAGCAVIAEIATNCVSTHIIILLIS